MGKMVMHMRDIFYIGSLYTMDKMESYPGLIQFRGIHCTNVGS
jgi:hypothetical protein